MFDLFRFGTHLFHFKADILNVASGDRFPASSCITVFDDLPDFRSAELGLPAKNLGLNSGVLVGYARLLQPVENGQGIKADGGAAVHERSPVLFAAYLFRVSASGTVEAGNSCRASAPAGRLCRVHRVFACKRKHSTIRKDVAPPKAA